MKYKAFSVRAISLLVTLSCVPLLLADSIAPEPTYCERFTFNRRFDVTTTCGGNQSGRVHVNETTAVLTNQYKVTTAFTLSNVQLPLKNVEVSGRCEDEDEPFTVTNVFFTFGLPAGGGGAGGAGGAAETGGDGGSGGGPGPNDATCIVNLKTGLGKDITCTAPSGETCTAHVVAGP